MVLILRLKTTLIYRDCNLEINDSGDNPEHDLMIHYNNLQNNLM